MVQLQVNCVHRVALFSRLTGGAQVQVQSPPVHRWVYLVRHTGRSRTRRHRILQRARALRFPVFLLFDSTSGTRPHSSRRTTNPTRSTCYCYLISRCIPLSESSPLMPPPTPSTSLPFVYTSFATITYRIVYVCTDLRRRPDNGIARVRRRLDRRLQRWHQIRRWSPGVICITICANTFCSNLTDLSVV